MLSVNLVAENVNTQVSERAVMDGTAASDQPDTLGPELNQRAAVFAVVEVASSYLDAIGADDPSIPIEHAHSTLREILAACAARAFRFHGNRERSQRVREEHREAMRRESRRGAS